MNIITKDKTISKNKLYKIEKLTSFFFIYSFLGFIIEELIFIFIFKSIVYRGLLYLPILPIYGFGAVLVTLIYPDKDYEILSIFIVCTLLLSFFEYISSFILEKSLNIRLWDYSLIKYNLNGRISLISSCLFGFGAVFIVKIVNPILDRLLRKYKNFQGLDILLSFLIIITFIDFMISIIVKI